MNQVQRINSDLARLSLEEELMKKKNRIESIDKVSLKQSFLSSLKEIYKSLSFENILPAPFGPNLNQSLNILDKICSQLSSSYDQEEFDKKFQYYYEQIKEPSIKVLLKESSSFSNLKKIDPQSISQIYDKKLNQMFSINRQYQTQKEINDSTQEENELIVNSYFGNQNIVFQNFDRICHFNTFFPQNNFNQIHKQLKMQQIMNLQKIKQINSNYQSSPKNGNKKSLTKEEKNECELHLNNQNLFRTQGITSISYGVGYRINRNSPQTK